MTHIEGTPSIDFGYDFNGNIASENTWTYVYDLSNQLIRVLDGSNQMAEYTYNGAGQRIKKVTQTETRIFHYDLMDHLIAETNQSGQMLAEYVYLGDQLLAMIKPGDVAYYYHNDHLGTPQVLTDGNGSVAWKAVYTPFGEAVASIQTVENPFRFPGQYYDQETGFHHNYFRYYNPQTGRYVTPDPIGLEGGINLYLYVANNPVNFIDPLGLRGLDYLLKNWDYISLNINIAIFNPWTLTLLGFSGQIVLDRYGNIYVGPGATLGKTFLTPISGSVTAGVLFECESPSKPSEAQLKNFLSGHSINFGGGYWAGGSITKNLSGGEEAFEIGFVTPQAGITYHHSWFWKQIGIKW